MFPVAIAVFVYLFVCLLDNFNIGHKLWTLSDRAFIFGKSLYKKKLTCDLDSSPVTYFEEKIKIGHTFLPFQKEPSYFTCRFLVTRASHSYKKNDLWPWPSPGTCACFTHKHILFTYRTLVSLNIFIHFIIIHICFINRFPQTADKYGKNILDRPRLKIIAECQFLWSGIKSKST